MMTTIEQISHLTHRLAQAETKAKSEYAKGRRKAFKMRAEEWDRAIEQVIGWMRKRGELAPVLSEFRVCMAKAKEGKS